MVVKNSIARRTLEALEVGNLIGMINGMCGVVFVGEDIIAASKVLVDFKKEHGALDIKGGVIEGSAVSFDKIKELAALPSRDALLAVFASAMYSPVTGFANSLGGLIRKFVYAINAVKEKKGVGK